MVCDNIEGYPAFFKKIVDPELVGFFQLHDASESFSHDFLPELSLLPLHDPLLKKKHMKKIIFSLRAESGYRSIHTV